MSMGSSMALRRPFFFGGAGSGAGSLSVMGLTTTYKPTFWGMLSMNVSAPRNSRAPNPSIISRIARIDLRARMVVEGYVSGLHKSPFKGFSVEFAEHREYVPGDDLRYLDWKVFGKSDRYYVKRYEEETNLVCTVVLDVSESMDFGTGEITKADYARTVAAALSYLIVKQHDAASLVTFDTNVRDALPPGSHEGHLRKIFNVLENAEATGRTDIGKALLRVAD